MPRRNCTKSGYGQFVGIWAAAACGTLKEYRVKYGTIENYFSDALGIDSAAQKALRDLYLVQE